ncbi:universal stress protein, partial [Singulisphaera rosea]
GLSRKVHLVSVAEGQRDAARQARRAAGFLSLHDIDATVHPVGTTVPPAEVILEKSREFEAGLLVMGAFGQSALREFFLGSVTQAVLRKSPVPVFCCP